MTDDHDHTADAPESVPCPCGTGEASLRERTISEPYTFDASKRAVHYHYRHNGCALGGTIVPVDGAIKRRLGPVFEPERYSVEPGAVATDGGGA